MKWLFTVLIGSNWICNIFFHQDDTLYICVCNVCMYMCLCIYIWTSSANRVAIWGSLMLSTNVLCKNDKEIQILPTPCFSQNFNVFIIDYKLIDFIRNFYLQDLFIIIYSLFIPMRLGLKRVNFHTCPRSFKNQTELAASTENWPLAKSHSYKNPIKFLMRSTLIELFSEFSWTSKKLADLNFKK